ncbi:MAG: hypothetical protein JWM59_2734 [Verrucomicrobiales bacterium]|nr:hypothetical protein [Verrucomicrobiales bacterium]
MAIMKIPFLSTLGLLSLSLATTSAGSEHPDAGGLLAIMRDPALPL